MKTKNLILSAVALLSVFVAVNVCADSITVKFPPQFGDIKKATRENVVSLFLFGSPWSFGQGVPVYCASEVVGKPGYYNIECGSLIKIMPNLHILKYNFSPDEKPKEKTYYETDIKVSSGGSYDLSKLAKNWKKKTVPVPSPKWEKSDWIKVKLPDALFHFNLNAPLKNIINNSQLSAISCPSMLTPNSSCLPVKISTISGKSRWCKIEGRGRDILSPYATLRMKFPAPSGNGRLSFELGPIKALGGKSYDFSDLEKYWPERFH